MKQFNGVRVAGCGLRGTGCGDARPTFRLKSYEKDILKIYKDLELYPQSYKNDNLKHATRNA